MGKKSLILPERRKKKPLDLYSWGSLKNKFSGRALFRTRLYEIVSGDLSSINIVKNKWYFEELLNYSLDSLDINMRPALKKIAGSVEFDETTRQRASEITEFIEDKENVKNELPQHLPDCNEIQKYEYARRLLAGTRNPQTTEILRLLRDKSLELKRLALFVIGKFKITDMFQEVCACFHIHGLEEDAYSVIRSLGKISRKNVDRCYLSIAGRLGANKAIMQLLAKYRQNDDFSFLLERLWSTSRSVRETVLEILLDMDYEPDESVKEKLKANIIDTFEILSWIMAAGICLQKHDNTVLSSAIEKEYHRWKEYLLGLLFLVYGREIRYEKTEAEKGKPDQDKLIGILAEVIFSPVEKIKDLELPSGTEKKFKKLQRYLHGEIPQYDTLHEDIINCDYNILSVWTKACALRSLPEIKEINMQESVASLLFSPEEILREEAALLMARTGLDLSTTGIRRVPPGSRQNIERILKGEASDKGMIYEKVKFLSRCIDHDGENELISLAEKTILIKNDEKGIYSQPDNSILWAFTRNNTGPDVFVKHETAGDIREMIKDLKTDITYGYVLSFSVFREYGIDFPENTYSMLRYIDKIEE